MGISFSLPMSPAVTRRPLVAIPARWGSTRFPGKPLHHIAGKPLVQHVWERCLQCQEVGAIVIATDDERIATTARNFGAQVVMTAADHPSGTDRIAEAAAAFPEHECVINVQGDEPLISPALIDELARTLQADPGVRMITAAAPIHDPAQMTDPNIVKVVLDQNGDSLYFSRSPLPYVRDATAGVQPLRHLGLYGYQRAFLQEFISWPPSLLEKAECLEQLRALEHGVRLRVVLTQDLSPGVDTPEQAAAIEALLLR
jgi:3-deoxy-manno-octulosonate cytidylyltransferase (CMP-KDO synthetase)